MAISNHRESITRVTRSRQEACTAYNKLSRWYDVLAGAYEKKYIDAAVKSLAITPGEIVLEIGFGTGHGILKMALEAGSTGKVHGIDIAMGMLNVARERINQTGLSERVSLIAGDAIALPYLSASFDAVLISFTLELFDTPEIPVVLSECRRVLKNGGRIGVVALSRGNAGANVRIYEWLHRKLPAWIDCRPIYPLPALEDAGFTIRERDQFSMSGLPGEMVLAQKH